LIFSEALVINLALNLQILKLSIGHNVPKVVAKYFNGFFGIGQLFVVHQVKKVCKTERELAFDGLFLRKYSVS